EAPDPSERERPENVWLDLVKFLIDECLHTSLVAVAQAHGHDCFHVNWLGLSGETD
ncbi:hypothetical protein RCCGEPOP_03161, partial [Rhizobium sp. Pop5]